MTTIVPFTPNNSNTPPFATIFTLDGVSYNGAVTWNIAAQRWYLSLTDQGGVNIWTGGLVGSPLTADILLAPGIFTTSTLIYREDSANFEVTP